MNRSELTEANIESGREDAPSGWQPIDTAPKDGRRFLVCQDGEVYEARYSLREAAPPRLTWRTHTHREQSKHQLITVEHCGEMVQARVPIEQPWVETFDHNWTLWTRGFDFAPSHWAPLPAPPDGASSAPHTDGSTTGSDQDLILSLTKEVEGLKEALEWIADAADPDAGENYRADDREGCLDFVHATARTALSTSGRAET